MGSRPGHGSMERGKQAWSDPEAGGCCQAEGGRRVKATSSVHHTCGCFCGLYETAGEVREGPRPCHCRELSCFPAKFGRGDVMTVLETHLHEGRGASLGEAENFEIDALQICALRQETEHCQWQEDMFLYQPRGGQPRSV